MKVKQLMGSILFVAGFIVLWQLLYAASTDWFGWAKPYAVPHPLGVCQTIVHLTKDGTLLSAIISSMLRVLAGFAISIVIGVIFGILILRSKFLARNLKPLILGVQTLPSICWVPFAILWFGLGESAIIFVVVMGSAFSISLAVEGAIRNIPPIYTKAAKTMGVSPSFMYQKVIFPAALPALLSGLKQGWSFAWRALMSAEMVQAASGLGRILMYGRQSLNENQIMLVMLLIIIIGIVVDRYIFGIWERHLARQYGTSR